MEPVIYYRESLTPPEEVSAIQQYFPGSAPSIVGLRDMLVVGRYSVLPFYADQEREFSLQGSRLINSHLEHRYIADFDWYWDLEGLTPKTWFRLSDVPKDGGPFVLKGRTNSRKHEWATHMYAETFRDALEVASRLKTDSLIGEQEVVVREFLPLRVLETGINGLPFSNEWRFFFFGKELLSYGFYWTSSEERGSIDERGVNFALDAARRIAPRVPFFALDIAETEGGDWTVIEVNDGQMAGLSENDPEVLYRRLAEVLGRSSDEDREAGGVPG